MAGHMENLSDRPSSTPTSNAGVIYPGWGPSPAPRGVQSLIGAGGMGKLGLLSDGTVLKFPRDKHCPLAHTSLELEHRILSALGDNDRLIKYLGKDSHGLRFEHAKNGDLFGYVLDNNAQITSALREKWLLQAAQAVAFVHSKGALHSDICPNNFLLDEDLNLKICDFGGAVLGALDGQVVEHERFRMPRGEDIRPTVKTDLFALASTFYFILTGGEPFYWLEDEDVARSYENGEFPNVYDFRQAIVLMGCWRGLFDNAVQVEFALRNVDRWQVPRQILALHH
ncbi:kinase-like protein [Pyrenochaeta sp. DS3sAY3a]|nr:kinase-like protein [Pyrenochaeta sp. DS3sAY3a]